MQNSLKQQSGVVLMVSLIFILMLSLIGVSGSQVTSIEEKMAGNSRDQNIAFQAAEVALRAGELVIFNQTNKTVFTSSPNNNNGLFLASANPDYKVESTWTNSSVAVTTNIPLVASQPRYFIEYISDKPSDPSDPSSTPASYFRVTARGVGRQDTTRVFLQSYYRKIF